MPKPLFITLLIALPVLLGLATQNGWVWLITVGLVLLANPIIRTIRKNRYFGVGAVPEPQKAEIASVVAEHNEVVNYVAEIRSQGSFELGASSTGQHAHLVTFENTSAWNYRRDRNVAEYAPHVHNASLQVVRNASQEPIKYLMKYFGIKADQATLADVQRVADDIARLEEAVDNVQAREAEITAKINPPAFIMKYYASEFWDQVGVSPVAHSRALPAVHVPVHVGRRQLGSETPVQLNTPTLEALSETLVEKIRWTKSAAGQRALMTTRLRNSIKERDRYTCRLCGVSLAAEPHLLARRSTTSCLCPRAVSALRKTCRRSAGDATGARVRRSSPD